MFHRVAQAFRISLAIRDLNAGISLRLVWWNRDLKKQSLRALCFKPNAQAAVIINAYKIARILDFFQVLPEFVKGKRRTAALDAFSKIVVEPALDESADPAICGRLRPARLEYNIMLRPANIRAGLQRMNHAISRGMRQTEIARDPRQLNEPAFSSRWKLAQKIAQRSNHPLGESLKQRYRFFSQKRLLRLKPKRIRKMVQRYKRPYAAIMQRLEHLAI